MSCEKRGMNRLAPLRSPLIAGLALPRCSPSPAAAQVAAAYRRMSARPKRSSAARRARWPRSLAQQSAPPTAPAIALDRPTLRRRPAPRDRPAPCYRAGAGVDRSARRVQQRRLVDRPQPARRALEHGRAARRRRRAPAPSPPRLRERRALARLEAVNRYVNARVRFVDDRIQFGVADRWMRGGRNAAPRPRRLRGLCDRQARDAAPRRLRRQAISTWSC